MIYDNDQCHAEYIRWYRRIHGERRTPGAPAPAPLMYPDAALLLASSSVGLVRGHTCCPARVASCWRGRTCPYRLHGRCWFGHDDDLEEDPPCRDVAATSCRDAATASDLLVRVRRLERIVGQIGSVLVPQIKKGDVDGFVGEQIGAVPVPQIWEPIVDGPHLVPQVRVQNGTPEQIVDVPVPQITEDSSPGVPQERVQKRTPEQIVDVPVPQIMEDSLPFVPQARVQNRTPEQIVDVPVPQLMEDSLLFVPQERVQNRTPEQILMPPCLSSWRQSWKLCRLRHGSVCRIARRSKSWISPCLSSWRQSLKLCRLRHRSVCRIERCAFFRAPPGVPELSASFSSPR